ncbi:MAG: hypothetical protein JWP19_2522 [Rhodoglobus sp.]|jgi:DNA-binding IclR family transcriptional regulator|nr:hypothetical protein [Rhodoglobus sp.]
MAINTGTVQSVRRALAILECIATSHRDLSASEISGKVGTALPTTYHLLKTLEVDGYIRRGLGGYVLSAKLGEMAAQSEARMAPDPLTLDTMRSISLSTGETAYTSRWLHGDVVVEGVAEASQAVRVAGIHVGLRGHAYARASGRVLLAFGPPERMSYLRNVDLQPLTKETLTTVALIEAEIAKVASVGHAIDRSEFTAGVCCISVPVWGTDGVCRAVTVSVPESRFEAHWEHLITIMRDTVSRAGLGRSA